MFSSSLLFLSAAGMVAVPGAVELSTDPGDRTTVEIGFAASVGETPFACPG